MSHVAGPSLASVPIQCACGAWKAQLAPSRRALRVVCYCRDCQSYAHFLAGRQAEDASLALDAQGGSEVIACAPERLELLQGSEQLRCMSLSPQGTYRWYTHCCGSAVAVIAHNVQLAHVSIAASTLRHAGVDVAALLGPVQIVANPASAHGTALAKPAGQTRQMLGYGLGLLSRRLGGGWRKNPLLQAGTWQPIKPVQVLSKEKRQQLRSLAALPPDGDL